MSVKTLHAFLVRRALVAAFSRKWFDISPLLDMANAHGVSLNRHEDYKVVRQFHCVDFAKMPLDVREELFRQYVLILAWVLGVTITELTDEIAVIEHDMPQLKALQA